MKSTPSADPLDYEYPCNDCGVDVLAIGDWYLATPEIWKHQLGLGWDDNLCIACLDKRLGRRVLPPDIWPAQGNTKLSDQLMDRAGLKTTRSRKKLVKQ